MAASKVNRSAVTGPTILVARCTDGGANDTLPVELTCTTEGLLYCQLVASPTIDIGKVDQGTGGASAWKVDGSAVTQPISAAALPLPTGAATQTTLASVLAKLNASVDVTTNGGSNIALDSSIQTLIAAVTPFTTFVAINYSGGNQTVSTSGGLTMRGFNITTAGVLYVDCSGVTNLPYAVGVGTNLLAGVTRIYQTGSTAAGSIVY